MNHKVDKIGVHKTHCCIIHGCKYGDPNCPVVNGSVKQEYICEYCEMDNIKTLEEIDKMMNPLDNNKFFINIDSGNIMKWSGSSWIEIDLEKLLSAVDEVCECLVLENMEKPSFTFRKINNLNNIFNGENNEN